MKGLSLNMDRLRAAQPNAHAGPTVNATSLIQSVRDDLALPGQAAAKALNTFAGNFQQLAKSEMGSTTFRAKIDRLPACFLLLSTALSSSGGSAVANFATGPQWGALSQWLATHAGTVDRNAVHALLLSYDGIANGTDAAAKGALGRSLCQDLLIPILEALQ